MSPSRQLIAPARDTGRSTHGKQRCEQWLRQRIGLDRPVLFTVIARLCQIIGSAGTVTLVIRFLSPVEQGYYYTLLSLVALQIVFELGFSFVILQLAAHEAATLTISPDGRIDGDPIVKARLASVLRLTVRWYAHTALAFAILLLPSGILFFALKSHGPAHVVWLGPWITAVLASSVTLFLTPLCSFLEGCNQVGPVARLRMVQSMIVAAVSWAVVATGHGLYACAAVNLGWTAACITFLASRRRLFFTLLRIPTGDHGLSWRSEIWPFQWKIAVSSFCSYFTLQVFTPILFLFRGPREAGQMGLSLSVVGYLPIMAMCWIAPKAATFGQLVQRGLIKELDAVFFRTMKQSVVLMLLLVSLCFAAVMGVQWLCPRIASRIVNPFLFALLLSAAISSFAAQGMAVYLRAFRREPYLTQSIVISGLTLAGVLATVARWGATSVAILYFAISGVVGLVWAAFIFHTKRRSRARRVWTTKASAGALDELPFSLRRASPLPCRLEKVSK